MIFDANKVNYILRCYLPTWNYEERFGEMLKFCQETGTEHIMLFTDAQHMVWNQLTIEEAKVEAANIRRAIENFAQYGIKIGINSSYNMLMSRFDNSKHNDYDHWVMLADGSVPKRTPCLLDPKLPVYLKKFYTILAETNPEYIYIDDDHRYIFNAARNTWGCMCDLHMQKFSEFTGKVWNRELLKQSLSSDKNVRNQWIEFLGARLYEIADVIGDAVHQVNPEIKVGMMIPCLHSLNVMGHQPLKMAEHFQKNGSFLLRPSIGPYCDRDRMQIMPGLFYMELAGKIFGDTAEYTPEIETTPFSRMSKSMAVVRFHITQGILWGMNNPALSVCGYTGNSPYFEPEFAKMLIENRSFFEAVRQNAPAYGSAKGIQLLWKFDGVQKTSRNTGNVDDYYLNCFSTHEILDHLGIAHTYYESKTKFLIGDTAYALTDSEIQTMLKANLLLDATAAKALFERGYGEYLGGEVKALLPEFGAEKLVDSEYSGPYLGNYIALKDTRLDDVYELIPAANARVLSEIVDHDLNTVSAGLITFENRLGGKIAITNFRIAPIEYDLRQWICYQKQQLLRKVFAWMDEAEVAYVASPSCCHLQYYQSGKQTTIVITNLSYDITSGLTLNIKDKNLNLNAASFIDDDGLLKPLSPLIINNVGASWQIKIALPIFKQFIIICK